MAEKPFVSRGELTSLTEKSSVQTDFCLLKCYFLLFTNFIFKHRIKTDLHMPPQKIICLDAGIVKTSANLIPM